MNKYFYQHKWKLGAFLLVSMLGAVSVIMMTYVVQLLIESITEMNLEKLKIVSVLAIVYVLIDSYFDYLVEIVNEKLLQAIMKDLRSDLIQKLDQIDIATTQLIDENDYLNLFTNDLHIISENYLKEIFSMYNDIDEFYANFIAKIYSSIFRKCKIKIVNKQQKISVNIVRLVAGINNLKVL